MIEILSDSGEGRTFVFIHEVGVYQVLAQQAAEGFSQRVRVVTIKVPLINQRNWQQILEQIGTAIEQRALRQYAIVGFGDAGALAQYFVLTNPKMVRSIVLIDASFRSHPKVKTRIIDWVERMLPLGLPLRSRESGFDAKPFAQRIRCPALLVLTQAASTFIQSQAYEIAQRIPSAWVVRIDTVSQVEQFCELLDSFEGVPVKCPQKNRARAA